MLGSEKMQNEYGTQIKRMLLIFRYAGFAYSILQSMGYRQRYPVAVIFSRLEMVEELAGKLRVFTPNVLSLNASPKIFRKELSEVHDEVCLIRFMEGRYTVDNMEVLTELIRCGTVEEIRLEAPVVMVFHQVLPAKLCPEFSLILEIHEEVLSQLEEEVIDMGDKFLKDYILQNYKILNHELELQNKEKTIEKDREFWNVIPLLLALAFQNGENPRESVMRNGFDKAVLWAYERTDFYGADKQIKKLFQEILDTQTPAICKFWPEERVGELADEEWREWILYDEQFYFMPEKIFEAVCRPLDTFCNLNQIKQLLANGGLISIEGRSRVYYTKKKLMEGVPGRIARYIWINREQLEGDNFDTTLVELFLLRRKV